MAGFDVADFQKDVLELSKNVPVLVDFWAEWCGPCKMLGPVLEKLAQRHDGEWVLKKLDTEQFPDVATEYGVRSIPNVKLFVGGEVADEFVGALPETAVERWLSTAIPDKRAGDLDRAQVLVQAHRDEEARVILEPILAASPDHERARTLLALSLLFTDRRRAVELVRPFDESSEYFDLAASIRAIDHLLEVRENPSVLPESPVKGRYVTAARAVGSKDFDKALEELIAVIREDRYYDDDGARKACIAIFKFLGEEHPVTQKHRRDFGNALYS